MAEEAARSAGTDMVIPAPVGSNFCDTKTRYISLSKKVFICKGAPRFEVKDSDGALLFNLNGQRRFLVGTDREVLRDASGHDWVDLKRKNLSMHRKWLGYSNQDQINPKLLFTMGKSSVFHLKCSFDVFLESNRTETPDFQVKQTKLFGRDYTVLHHTTVIAQAEGRVET